MIADNVADAFVLGELDARAFRVLAQREARTVKPGRTHLQDAVPITDGHTSAEYRAYRARLSQKAL